MRMKANSRSHVIVLRPYNISTLSIGGGGCKEWRENKNRATMDRILTAKRGVEDLEILCRICNSWDYLLRKNEKQAQRFDVLWDES